MNSNLKMENIKTNKPISLVLGGTSPHIALIENLKTRGYYTVLIDYLEDPPARKYADMHLQISTLNEQAVLEVSKKLNASLVISTCIDQANVTACYVAENLGLTSPYSYETALKVTNKGTMKKTMIENGILTPKHVYCENIFEIDQAQLNYPLVVKPPDSTGSKGVRRVNSKNKIDKHFKSALAISRSNSVVVEEFIEGVELQVDCYAKVNAVEVVMIREKNRMNLYGEFVMQSIGSTVPVNISVSAQKKIFETAQKIAETFELFNTPFFIQLVLDNNENVYVLEFAPRIGGGLSFKMVKRYTNFDYLNAAIDSFLGLTPVIKISEIKNNLSSVILYATEGEFYKVEGYKELLESGTIDEYFHIITPGRKIANDMSTGSRVGAFFVIAKTKDEMIKKIKQSIDNLDIIDNKGNSIMRKDIYSGIFT